MNPQILLLRVSSVAYWLLDPNFDGKGGAKVVSTFRDERGLTAAKLHEDAVGTPVEQRTYWQARIAEATPVGRM